MPPIAANTGIASRRRSRNSPRSSCRLASSPTTRKNSVIRPSLTQWRRSIVTPAFPTRTATLVVHTDSYECHQGKFAHRSAATAAPNVTTAPPDSVLRKLRLTAGRGVLVG